MGKYYSDVFWTKRKTNNAMKDSKHLKMEDGEDWIILIFIVFIVIPIALLYLLYKLLITPFDYIRYKHSRYQQDFPHRYSWLSEPHPDNDVYTAIKRNNLPVEYIKWSEDYDLCGYFVYKDILLDFTEPFFFDEERKIFLQFPDEAESEEVADAEEATEGDNRCLTVEETKKLILDGFRNSVPERECHKIVFFYSRKNVLRNYKKEGLNAMRELDNFIVYEKGESAKAIKDFVGNH